MINNIVQLSNLFNKIVLLHPTLQSYSFGWRSDVRVDNNYTLEQSLGKLYPRVTFSPPSIVHNVLKGTDTVSVQLFFDDLLFYGNDSSQKTKTKLEAMADLLQTAKEFLQELRVKGRLLNLAIVGETVNVTLDESTLIDRNIQVVLEFTLIYTSSVTCLNLDFEQQKADYPFPFEFWDYENQAGRPDINLDEVRYSEAVSTTYQNNTINFGGVVVGNKEDMFFYVNGVYIPSPKFSISSGNVVYVYGYQAGDEFSIKYRIF